VRRWGALLVPVTVLALASAGCGDSEETRYNDEKLVDVLNLEQAENGYMIDGDPFCEVENKLLNNASEVDEAADKDELGLVIASREGNAGVQGVPPFAPDCGDTVKRKLNKLDPVPKEDE